MRAMVEWVRSRVELPATEITETKLGASGASRLMVPHRLRSISSVFGGKNSKEMSGDSGARCPSVAGGVTSVMAPQTPLPQDKRRFLAGSPQNMPNRAGQTAHRWWEFAQFMH